MNKDQFKKSFAGKTVEVLGKFLDIPKGKYIVTSAVYQLTKNNYSLIDLLAEDIKAPVQSITIYISPEDFIKAIRDLRVLD